jgi:hypothetical protein
LLGGVAHITHNASASFLSCSFISNFAIKSGMFHLIEANHLSVASSTIIKNLAFANSIFSSEYVPKIEIIGSEIASN